MSTFRRTAFSSLVLGLGAMRALAGQHVICYEAPPETRSGQVWLKAIAGCHDDTGQACTIKSKGPTSWQPDSNAWRTGQGVASIGNFQYFEFNGSGSGAGARLDLEVSFSGRPDPIGCTVQAWGVLTLGGPRGYGDGVLTGFSSDASGLVSTGVWRSVTSSASASPKVPGDFIASGGGFETEPGAFARIADRVMQTTSPNRNWQVQSLTDALKAPARTTAYVVGLRIQGLDSQRELVPQLTATGASSASWPPRPVSAPSVRVSAPADTVVVGGGVQAFADASNSTSLWGQFASATAPVDDLRYLRCVILLQGCAPLQPTGWETESKDEAGAHPGSVTASLLALPRKLTIQGKDYEVRAKMVDRTSGPGTTSTAKVDGLRGEYALTNVGARTLWAAYNPGCDPKRGGNPANCSSRLQSVVPLPDVGGASATVTHGGSATVAAVTAYAQGIKLVEAGTPPEVEEAPWKGRMIDIAWWCTLDERLNETPLCQYTGKSIAPEQVCASFPWLADWGYCKPGEGQ